MADLYEQYRDGLIAPISEDAPCGIDLRWDDVYDQIKDARRQDTDLPMGEWQPLETKRADWPRVEKLSIEALTKTTKDLQIAVWLCEAWLRMHGFAGLHAGMELLAELTEIYWDGLFPAIEDNDTERRLAPLYGMLAVEGRAEFMQAVKSLPILKPSDDDRPAASLLDIDVARAWDRRAQVETAWNEEPEPEPAFTMSVVVSSAALTPSEFFGELTTQVNAILETIARLEATIDEQCRALDAESVSFRPLRETLERIRTEVRSLGGNASGPLLDDEHVAAGDGGNGVVASAGGPIRSREDAYRMLGVVQEYLQRIEPHSPTPYLIRRAMSWGRLSVTELLRELLEDNSDINGIYRLLGIRDQQESE